MARPISPKNKVPIIDLARKHTKINGLFLKDQAQTHCRAATSPKAASGIPAASSVRGQRKKNVFSAILAVKSFPQ
jgi:hypothetical protein